MTNDETPSPNTNDSPRAARPANLPVWLPLLIWLVGSLVAIALIGEAPYVGLAVALLSGIAFGLANIVRFKKGEKKDGSL